MQKYRASAGGSEGPLNYFFNTTYFAIDGYRDHSRSQTELLTGKARTTLDPQSDLTTIFTFTDSPLAEDPGGLTQTQVNADRRQARDLNTALDAGESLRQKKLGFVYRNEITDGHTLTVSEYNLLRDFAGKLPILPSAGSGIVDLNRTALGGDIRYQGETDPHGVHNRLLAALEVQHQDDDRCRFDNETGNQGSLRFDQQETVTGAGALLRDEFDLLENLQLNAGGRFDSIRFDVDDHFRSDGDDSGHRTFERFSPSAGLLVRASPGLQLYANAANAFQVPTTTELARPDEGGGFNKDLAPQQAVTYETGARATLPGHIACDIAIFDTRIEDELIPFEGESGRTFYRNAGTSTRRGVELALDGPIATDWTWSLAVTHLDATLEHYTTDAGTFDGNDEAGIPAYQCFAELAYRRPAGLFAALTLLDVDDFYADDANTTKNPAYALLNSRLGYEFAFGHARLTPFAGMNNLTDEHYNGIVRLNAAGARYFEPAPTRNAYAGLTLSCDW